MTKSALIALLARHQQQLPYQEVARAINLLITQLSAALAGGERIEIRGFGSFTRHCRRPRLGRNPKTGTPVPLAGRYVPYFQAWQGAAATGEPPPGAKTGNQGSRIKMLASSKSKAYIWPDHNFGYHVMT